MFLGKYKMMLGADCKMIYKSADYYRKRLKVLEQEKYIKRVNRVYIKLDNKGTKLVREFGYEYSFNCRKKEYLERLHEIAKIAALTINTSIGFIPSWDIKDNNIYTEVGRTYIGKLIIQKKEKLVYYISKKRQQLYLKQINADIQKIIQYKNIIIFIEDMDIVTKSNFVYGNESTIVVNPSPETLNIMRKLDNIDIYRILEVIYSNTEILLTKWKKADYITRDKRYILVMPFIDTEKLHSLNIFYSNNAEIDRKIDIITLKENRKTIEEILLKKPNIVEIDEYLVGGNDELEKEG